MTWRDGWDPLDPLRPCYTCGNPPSHSFDRDRNEPAYSCSHPPFLASPDDPPYGCWTARGTIEEWNKAFRRARKMIEENDERGWKTKYIPKGKTEIEMKARGIMAEVIAARLTGLRHDKMFLKSGYRRRKKRADIGANVEVRNTARHDGFLALYDNDPDDRIALLVTGTDPFTLRGWLLVREGRLRRLYHKEPSPGRWLVPQDMLHPMPLPPGA